MKKKWVFSLLLLALVLVFNLPYFAIQSLTLSPVNFLSEKKIMQHLDDFRGQNVFKVLLFNSVEKKLASILQIESVDVSLRFPNQIHCSIIEKSAWLSCMSEGKTTLLSKDGIILSRGGDFSIKNPDSLLVVKGMSEELFLQDQISGALLRQLQDIQALMNRYFSKDSILLEREAYQSWQLLLYNHLLIKLGALEDLDNKFRRLNHYLSMIDKENYSTINYIDLRLENKVLVN